MTQHAPPPLGMSVWLALIFECFHAKPRINTRMSRRSPAGSSVATEMLSSPGTLELVAATEEVRPSPLPLRTSVQSSAS